MSKKILISGVLVLAAPLLTGLLGNAEAKDPVVTLQPMPGAHLPAGSQISNERLRAMDIKIREGLKARQQAPSSEAPAQSDGKLR